MGELAALWSSIKSQAAFYATMLASTALEGLFVVIWWMIQWGVGVYITDKFPLPGLDAVTAVGFQIALAVGTVLPILIFVYTDLRVMWIRARRRIAAVQNETTPSHAVEYVAAQLDEEEQQQVGEMAAMGGGGNA